MLIGNGEGENSAQAHGIKIGNIHVPMVMSTNQQYQYACLCSWDAVGCGWQEENEQTNYTLFIPF